MAYVALAISIAGFVIIVRALRRPLPSFNVWLATIVLGVASLLINSYVMLCNMYKEPFDIWWTIPLGLGIAFWGTLAYALLPYTHRRTT
jgi:hypothetical protein